MRLPKLDYIEPKSVSESCRLLHEAGTDARIIAGGTDLLMAIKNRLKMPKLLVGLSRISALKRIRYTEKDGLKIGALVSLRHLASHPAIREKYPLLAISAMSMGSVQLQAMGTLGGNICQDACCIYYGRSPMMREGLGPCLKAGGNVCHAVKGSENCWATYCGDMAPMLLALRATIKVTDMNGEKIIPLGDIFSGKGEQPQSLSSSQIVTEVHVPPSAINCSGGAYLKMRMRKAIDYPLLGVAVNLSLEGGSGACKDITIGLTAVDKAPLFVQASASLKGEKDFHKVTEELSETSFKLASPIANTYGYSPKYRRDMVKVYVRRAIQQSHKIALGNVGAA